MEMPKPETMPVGDFEIDRDTLREFATAQGAEVVESTDEHEAAKEAALDAVEVLSDEMQVDDAELAELIQRAAVGKAMKGRREKKRGPGATRPGFNKAKARAKAKKARRANRR
ncbi:hypothetical protein [Vibrio phage vB_pir03]|nr:hypothetical protein [Vibrio phage vB_pir03]